VVGWKPMKLSESAGGGKWFLLRFKSERKQGYAPALRKMMLIKEILIYNLLLKAPG
jgi:hypothetical protein